MEHTRARHGDTHGSASGALISRPRRYELSAVLGFLGRRRQVYDGLVALSGARPGERILDIGCGTGYLTRRKARAVAAGGSAVGIDPSGSVIGYATRRAPDNATFRIATAQRLPFADGSFDAVVSSLAIHHLPGDDRGTALGEAYRVLKPGGRLLIVDLRRQPRHLRLANLAGLLSRHAQQHASADDLTGLVRRAGFDVTATGDRWPSLYYVKGSRPAAGTPREGSAPR